MYIPIPSLHGFRASHEQIFLLKKPKLELKRTGIHPLEKFRMRRGLLFFYQKKKEDNYFTGIMFSMKAIAKLIAISNQSQSQIEKKNKHE